MVEDKTTDNLASKPMTFDDKMDALRIEIKRLGATTLEHKLSRNECETEDKEDRGEVMANLTLAYRCLEDASMRIGKVKQHLNGGVSVYDKNVVGSPE